MSVETTESVVKEEEEINDDSDEETHEESDEETHEDSNEETTLPQLDNNNGIIKDSITVNVSSFDLYLR